MSEEQMTTDPWAGLRAPAESVGRHVDDSPLDDLTTRQLARSFVFGDLKRWALKQAPLEDQSEDDHTKYMGVGFTNPLTKSKRLRTKYGLEDVQSYRFPLIIAGRRVSHLLFWAPALLFPFIVLGILSIVQ